VRYVEAQSDRYAPNTVLKHMSIVSSGLQALRLWGLRHGGDPFAGEVLPPRKRQAHPEPKGLIYPFAEVVDAARTVGPRHELCVLLLGGVGLRASMAAQVHDHRIILGPFGRVCTVIAKGGREFSFPVPPALWALSRVDGWPCDAIPTGRNGVNRVGVALRGVKESDRRDRINEMVNDVARVMGVHLHPHQFRHWHVTMALELGVPLHIVQDSVGHADPKTTMGYARDRARVKDHTVWTVLADITGDRVPT
jgi:integrase